MNKPSERDIESLIELFEASDWKELDLKMEGFGLYLSKDEGGRISQAERPPAVRRVESAAAAPVAVADSPAASASKVPDHWVALRAPNLGTFYRAPKPGAPPYVEVGQHVDAASEVCLIEVMKLFTTVNAGTRGIVREVRARDAELVEYDQVLLYIEPD